MLIEPPETEYDVRFSALGFPVRISWTFWLGALVFGHSFCQVLVAGGLAGNPVGELGIPSFGIGPMLLLWVLCLVLSILIHELGHTLAFRYYGVHSSIVLYHFGGLAIPTGGYMPGRSVARIGPKEQLLISAAGPAAQIASALLLVAVIRTMGYQVAIFYNMPGPLANIPWVTDGEIIDNVGLYALVSCYVFPSILWGVLNLAPIYPLDGGQIARSLFLMNGGTVQQSLWLSVICSGAAVYYALTTNNILLALMAGSLGYASYQMLNQSGGSWR